MPGPQGGPREWTVVRWNGSEWIARTVTTSTHNYDMGQLWIDGDRWRILAPTEPGPQRWGAGGEVALWESTDGGGSWRKNIVLTTNSTRNHGYVRRPLDARPDFYALWADGHADTLSPSHLYFTNRTGDRFYRLPYTMTEDFATATVGYGADPPREVRQTRERLDDWLANTVLHHRYSLVEAARVAGLPVDEIEARVNVLKVQPAPPPGDRIRVLPYPGGRHPRTGFLDGAIDPMRGTKASIFTPWDERAYVVLDMPEAIFSNLGLTFLAHTHIPTIWDEQNIAIENVDWRHGENGTLESEWRLPNRVRFGMRVVPEREHVDLELWLENGSASDLRELRTQVCLMLKGAPGFNEQNGDRKRLEKPVAAVKHRDHDRWILIAFEQCGRAWGNAECPCIHSDPVLPDAAVGQRVPVTGRLLFYEGSDVEAAMDRLRQAL